MEKIILGISNGTIFSIQNGEGVIVRDYDTQGVDENVLQKDEEGDEYQEMVV